MNLSSNNSQCAKHQQMNIAQGAELYNPPKLTVSAIAQLQNNLKLEQLKRDLKQLHPKISHTLSEIESLRENYLTLCSSTTDVILQIQFKLKQMYTEISHTLSEIESLQANRYTLGSLTTKQYIEQQMRQQQFWISQLNQSVSIFVSQLNYLRQSQRLIIF